MNKVRNKSGAIIYTLDKAEKEKLEQKYKIQEMEKEIRSLKEWKNKVDKFLKDNGLII